MAVEIENRVREKLGVVARTPSVADAAASAAASPKAATNKASKAVAAEPDSEDDL
jgi:hypothetical protein